MAALVDCVACLNGDHDNHDGTWHGTEGLIGGYMCACPGGCVPTGMFDGFLSDFVQDPKQLTSVVEQLAELHQKVTLDGTIHEGAAPDRCRTCRNDQSDPEDRHMLAKWPCPTMQIVLKDEESGEK